MKLFTTFGIPNDVLFDNETAFVSSKIKEFYTENGAQAITSAPYHPATNRKAECYVDDLKRALLQDNTGSLQRRISHFLFRQHMTIHSGTETTPPKAMFG